LRLKCSSTAPTLRDAKAFQDAAILTSVMACYVLYVWWRVERRRTASAEPNRL
jgi:hypothetical protein